MPRTALLADFWDENGEIRRGEIINPLRVEGNDGRVVKARFRHERTNEVAIMTVENGELRMHNVLTGNVRNLKPVVTV